MAFGFPVGWVFFHFLVPVPFIFVEQVSIIIGGYLEIHLSVYFLFQIIYEHVAQQSQAETIWGFISEMPLLRKQIIYPFFFFFF